MLTVGQKVRIVNYDHPHCGEFGDVVDIFANGTCAILKLWRFPERRVAVPMESFDIVLVSARL
jgi:hypothetical protein